MIPDLIPGALRHNFDSNRALHERIVLLTVETETVPFVAAEARMDVRHIDRRFHQVILRYGYMQEPDIPKTFEKLAGAGLSLEPGKTWFFLGKESIIPTRRRRGMALWRERLFAFLTRNAWSAVSAFCLPPERSVEIRGYIEL